VAEEIGYIETSPIVVAGIIISLILLAFIAVLLSVRR